jgi:adenine deaminase
MTHSTILARRVSQALGATKADLSIRNGRYFDLVLGELVEGDVAICGDVIVATGGDLPGAVEIDARGQVIVPGFVDAHVHIESSLMTPWQFARAVLPRGTTTAVCDPHEIANVLGAPGIRWVLENSAGLPLDLRVMLPSCVPATALETSGARLDATDLAPFRSHPQVLGLAEVMNVPGVLTGDPMVLDKLALFPGGFIDGHAPLVSGRALDAYAAVGVCTCHESTTAAEAREKLGKGLRVLMRQGGVSKDVARLAGLLDDRTSPFMAFCTDDRSPLDLAAEGHVDAAIRVAIAAGAPPAAVYRAASWSAAQTYGLRDRGLVAPGWRADLALLDDLDACAVARVIRGGLPVDDTTFAVTPAVPPIGLDSMRLAPVTAADFALPARDSVTPVIGLRPGSLITDFLTLSLRQPDVAKLAVLCRHGVRSIGRGHVRGFGLRAGALAASVGHDSHNVTVVGVDDAAMALAVNRLIELGGGFVAATADRVLGEMALPVAGLLSLASFPELCRDMAALHGAARDLGCTINDPFLQLAFLALPVIPHLKLTDKGLVDVDRFQLI